MPRDPLPVLLRARRMAQDDARRALTAGVQAEVEASTHLARVDRAIAEEVVVMAARSAEEAAWTDGASWLGRARRGRGDARSALGVATEHADALRGMLGEARVATRVVELLQAQQARARLATAARQEQAKLDEMGQRRPSGFAGVHAEREPGQLGEATSRRVLAVIAG